jgi:hypothetical protein
MPRVSTESYGTGDQSWLGSTHGIYNCRSVALDMSLFTAAEHYPNGYIKSGYPLGKVTATELYGPYTGDSTDEVQTLTVGGSGLTSFTLTFGGQTTAAIAANATAAQVQAALEALSSVGVGDVAVTGNAGGPWTVKFQGELANQNVAQLTATPTGGTGTVTPATTTAGGADASSDGREVLAGYLYTDQPVKGLAPTEKLNVPLLDHGRINVDLLPIPFALSGHNTTGQFVFVGKGA